MKLSTLLVALSSSAAALAAAPLTKRALGDTLICTGANGTGICVNYTVPMNTCNQLAPPFFLNTSTFAPENDSFYCFPRAYSCGGICTSPTGCTFGAVNSTYEHRFDLGAIGWTHLFASFDCAPYQ